MKDNKKEFEFLEVAKMLSPEYFEAVQSGEDEIIERVLRQGWQGELISNKHLSRFEKGKNIINIALKTSVTGNILSDKLIESLPLFLLPNNGIEAYTTFDNESGRHIVIVNDKILGLCDALARIISQLILSTYYPENHFAFSTTSIKSRAAPNLLAWVRYYAGFSRHTPTRLDTDMSNSDLMTTQSTLTLFMEGFIAGHEFAHFACDHLSACDDDKIKIHPHDEELEADKKIINAILEKIKKDNIPYLSNMLYLSIWTLFQFFGISEKIMKEDGTEIGYHPEAEKRWSALEKIIGIPDSKYVSSTCKNFKEVIEMMPDMNSAIKKLTNNPEEFDEAFAQYVGMDIPEID